MSDIEHLIENAIVCVQSGKSREDFMGYSYNQLMLARVKATGEEIFEMAQYVVYAHDEYKDDWGCRIAGVLCKDGHYELDAEGKITAWVCENLNCPCHDTIDL